MFISITIYKACETGFSSLDTILAHFESKHGSVQTGDSLQHLPGTEEVTKLPASEEVHRFPITRPLGSEQVPRFPTYNFLPSSHPTASPAATLSDEDQRSENFRK